MKRKIDIYIGQEVPEGVFFLNTLEVFFFNFISEIKRFFYLRGTWLFTLKYFVIIESNITVSVIGGVLHAQEVPFNLEKLLAFYIGISLSHF